MSDITVPQDEIKRLINQLLATFNQQVGLSGEDELNFDKVSYEFVEPREGHRNALKLVTDDSEDSLVLRISIEYSPRDIIDITPFRLELIENAVNGVNSKIYVAQAKLPGRTFPTAAKILYVPTGKVEFTALTFTGDTVTVKRTGGVKGIVTMNIRDGESILGVVTFADGDDANKTFDTNISVPKVISLTDIEGADQGGRVSAVVNSTLLRTVVWDDASEDFALDVDEEIVLTATRSGTGPALQVPIKVTFGEDDPINANLAFLNGETAGTVTLAVPDGATSYTAVIQTGSLYTRGTPFTKTGDITPYTP